MLSIVVPCRNAANVLGVQLAALAEEPPGDWEVVVVDNGSTDATVDVARTFAHGVPFLTIASAPSRVGRHHACNVGVRHSRGERLLFLDSDDQISPGFVRTMDMALRRFPVVVPRFEYGALNDPEAQAFAYQTTRVESTDFLPAGCGSGFGIQTQAFHELGGFDETMDFCEDLDLSWRIALAGMDIRFEPDAELHVRQRTDLTSMFRQHFQFGVAAARLYKKFRKHGMQPRALSIVRADWWMVLASVPRLSDRNARVRWVRRAGRAAGRLVGSLRHGVWYL